MTKEIKDIINLLDLIEKENKIDLNNLSRSEYYHGLIKGQLILIKILKYHIKEIIKKELP